jgi:hypothetical protein
MPGPTLLVHGAGRGVDARTGDTSIGARNATMTTSAAAARDQLGRAGLGFLRIDSQVGDGLGNEVRTVLLAKRQRV